MITINRKYVQAFTLIETVSALIISGIVFVGVFSVFAILNNRFEAELIRGELAAYCNYALDDISRSIRIADDIIFRSYDNNPMIMTSVADLTQHTYALSEDEGILKDGIPIHEELEVSASSTDAGISKHKIFYIPRKKNGFIKYLLDDWKIYPLSDNNDNTIYTTSNPVLLESSFVIELNAKLIMGWDENLPLKEITYKRIAFCAGKYINWL